MIALTLAPTSENNRDNRYSETITFALTSTVDEVQMRFFPLSRRIEAIDTDNEKAFTVMRERNYRKPDRIVAYLKREYYSK